MKKYGKKWRKLQKEKESLKKTNVSTARPFLRTCQTKMLCTHYTGRVGGILPGSCHSLLIEKNEKECICTKCKKVFPIKKMAQMNRLVAYLSNKGCMTDEKLINKLSRGIEPAYYYKVSENEMKIDLPVEVRLESSL